MKNAAFSVLMSVYHKENPRHFDLSLESNLVKQTRLPDEMVLVCDGPLTEELDAVIQKYEALCPDVLQVYRLEQNVGLGKALSYGLEQCRYDYVARSDSDDICEETRFEKQLDFIVARELDVVSSYISEFEEDPAVPLRVKRLPLEHEELAQMAKFRNPINHMATMFRKSKILEVGSYQHLAYVEDYYLWVRAIVGGAKLGNMDECLVHARVGNGMEKRRGNRAYIASWRQLSRYMRKHRMINRWEYLKNMISVRAFVYMPTSLKSYLYNHVLRKAS